MVCYGHPVAGTSASGQTVAGCWAMDNSFWYETSWGGAWTDGIYTGGALLEALGVRGFSSSLVVDVVGTDNAIYEMPVDPSGFGGWGRISGYVTPTDQPPYTIWVPVYAQSMPLDCETAAMQMALRALGYYYTQNALFGAEGADYTSGYWSGSTLHWRDPFTHFVGNPNGSEGNYTGYGVYFPPILNIAHGRGAPRAAGGQGYNSVSVYNALAETAPVQVWIEYQWRRPPMGSWWADDTSRWIRYSTWEHSVTLAGVSPTAVLVNDPGHGTQYWVSRSTFEVSWGDFGNMAVIYNR
jgi:uncharacterized protein YvpB